MAAGFCGGAFAAQVHGEGEHASSSYGPIQSRTAALPLLASVNAQSL